MSKAEWDAFQNRIPPEDRVPYEEAFPKVEDPAPSPSFTDYWEKSAEFWDDMGDRYAEEARAAEAAAKAAADAAAEAAAKAAADAAAEAAAKAAADAAAEAARKAAEEAARLAGLQGDNVKVINPVPLSSGSTGGARPTTRPPKPQVKTAPIDTILFDEEAMPIEIMADLIFENIGGQELINIARTDTVNGQQVVYQPIKNLTEIQTQYNPNNILSLQDTSDKYFQNFAIQLDIKTPPVNQIYIDPLTGDLIIEAIDLESDEQIEAEITTSGTIYEAQL